jgi:hypothetical protein
VWKQPTVSSRAEKDEGRGGTKRKVNCMGIQNERCIKQQTSLLVCIRLCVAGKREKIETAFSTERFHSGHVIGVEVFGDFLCENEKD